MRKIQIKTLNVFLYFPLSLGKRRSSRMLLGQLDAKLLERKLSRIESDGTLNNGQGQGQGQGQANLGGSSDTDREAEKVGKSEESYKVSD